MPEPTLDATQQERFARGWRQFDDGHYFECHDTLEELWRELHGPARDFFQGLVQWAVAFHHLTQGNLAGARSLLARAEARQRAYPARYCGLDLAELRAQGVAWQTYLRAQAEHVVDPGASPSPPQPGPTLRKLPALGLAMPARPRWRVARE